MSEKTRKQKPSPPSLPLFYSQPVLLRHDEHQGKAFRPLRNFSFAAQTNAVPLNIGEFMPALRHFPIVFSGAPIPSPVALLGLKQGQNLFLTQSGSWLSGVYLPAYLRRYPFITMEIADQQQLMLGIDAASEAFVDLGTAAEAQPFFDDNRTPTRPAEEVMAFCEAFHQDYLRTKAFIEALVAEDLFIMRQANIQLREAGTYQLQGFSVVDPERLRNLKPDILADWEAKGWLSAIHLHIASMQNWSLLLELNLTQTQEAA